MMFKGKSERMKKLGKLSIVPGIFGINEMVIFGLPVVLNPIIAIPFLLTPLVNTILGTLATMLHIIPRTTGTLLPWTTPLFFSGWLSTGSIIAGLFQIVQVAIGCMIYYPFFKILDNQYLQDETKPVEQSKEDDLEDISLDDISF
jgi:cellobiose permease IIC component